jgi:23S rRNA (cytidine1920-2'-O)/16S rRNA (cytidine1409-2'-O)-methyltransferase
VRRRLVESRDAAREAIDAGRVLIDGAPALKPTRMVLESEQLVVTGPPRRFVGRGGEKLAAALERFAVDPRGRVALDAGASTGGFTDCLLQAGATRVIAVDVGYGQLHERLRSDTRVDVRERVNIRELVLTEPVDLVVADLSFISLRTVAPARVGANAAPGADVVVLVKPQFEAGRREADKGRGIISDPAVWRRVLGEVRSALSEQGATMMDVMVSPLTGADGNVEFLAHVRAHTVARGVGDADLDAAVAEVGR